MRAGLVISVTLLLCFIVTGVGQAHASSDEKITLHYEKPYKTSTNRMYYDLSKIDLGITNVQVLSMDDTPGYTLDDADLVKITVSVTDNGDGHFALLDKMFELWIMKPTKADPQILEPINNYDTRYDDELEVIYEKMNSRELFEECDQTIKTTKPRESLNLTLCYNILKVGNDGGIKIGGQKKYMLVMMDNQQASSCPNCKKIMLTKYFEPDRENFPLWAQRLFDWKEKHLISEMDLQNSLNYLAEIGMSVRSEISAGSDFSLAMKNKELAKYQEILSTAYSRNLFVSAIEIFETKYSDEFTGAICKKQNNIITLEADYTNDEARYDTIFFRLKIYDSLGNTSAEGLSKLVDVAPKTFRHVSVSTPSVHNTKYCEISVDSKFT